MAELGSATFVASVRSERAIGDAQLDADGLPRLTVTSKVRLSHTVEGVTNGDDVSTRIDLYGPGDVVGIAPQQVLRVFPASGEHAAEPNYLASIEFDDPELPWLVSLSTTPTKARPWIALAVVPDDGTRLGNHAGSALQWVHCTGAELPPSDELWAWAHAHAIGNASVTAPQPGDGRATLSRLLSPLKLRPNTKYLAAVVPTYHAGVLAARREDPSKAGDQPAWKDTDTDVSLPAYHYWRFATGPAGDFEQVARQLQPRLATDIGPLGRIELRLGEKGLEGVPSTTPISALRTLLVSPAETAAMLTDTVAAPVKVALGAAIDAGSAADEARVVRPPRYGQWPAGDPPAESGPAWFVTLNLSPSHRVLARLGADLIRVQQEELVAEARRQLGEFRAARRARDLMRIGEMTATRLHTKVVEGVADERVLALARPAFEVLADGSAADVADTTATPGFGMSLLAPSFTRIARRAAATADVAPAEMRTRLVTAALDGALFAPTAATTRPPLDLTRTEQMFTRVGVMERTVGGLRVDQLLQLAPSAVTAQQDLVTSFAGTAIDIHAVEVEVQHGHGHGHGIHIGGHGGHDDGDGVVIDPRHGHGIDLGHGHVPIEIPLEQPGGLAGLHIEREHRHLDIPLAVQPGVHAADAVDAVGAIDAVVAQPVMPFAAPIAGRGIDLGVIAALPIDIANERVGEQASTSFAKATVDATASMRALATQLGIAQAPATVLSFSDLVVDQQTMSFTTSLQPANATAMQFDVRSAVRRNLGLPVTAPVLRDQLSGALQQQFDTVVGALLTQRMTSSLKFPDAPEPVTAQRVAANCRPGLAASRTFAAAAAVHLAFADGLVPTLVHMGFVPKFDAPLVNRLDDAMNRWILAGADLVPPNTITVLETNPAFIEAFIAGANHEMARELLWRDVPSDPRGTVFERFWNTPDTFPEVHTWRNDLGKNLGDGSPYLCVLLRSPLLRKFPNAVLYAARGSVTGHDDEQNFEPLDPPEVATLLHTGPISPDMTYSVVALTEEAVRQRANDPHPWYLLLGEPVTEPRFGMDASVDSHRGELNLPAELAWGDESPGPMLRTGDPKLAPLKLGDFRWGQDAAQTAAILHQDPFRLVLPAADYLPKVH